MANKKKKVGTKKEKTAKVHTLIMTAGYVESNKNASVIAYNSRGFNSVEEAMKDFATALVQSELEERDYRVKNPWRDCCKEALGNEAKFCAECGSKLTMPEYDFEDYMNIIYSFFVGENDRCGDMWEYLTHRSWNYGGYATKLQEPIIWIHEHAESLLAEAYMDTLQEVEDKWSGRKLDGSYKITGKQKVKIYNE